MKTRSMKRRLVAAGAAAVMTASILATTATQAAAEADNDDKNSLLVAAGQEVDTFNPFKSRFIITYNTNLMTYDTLVRASAVDYEPEPGLATDWDESDDGLTWTFSIREGVEWSDGEPLTAHDVAYTYQLLIEDEGVRSWNIDFAGNLASAEAPDDTTFVLTLNQPAPAEVLNSGTYIVPKHIWENYDDPADDNINDELPLVGSGPFQVSEYRTDEFIRLEANENYWDGAPGFDEVVYVYYNEPDAAVAALETGEVDIVNNLNPAQAAALEGQDGITVNNAQNRRWVSLVLNHGARTADGDSYGDGHPALQDQAVRQALHHAIDKEVLVETVLDGNGDPGVGIVPRIFENFHWDGGDELVQFDLDEANRILDEAGYELGDDGIRTMPDGDEELSFRFYHHADSTDYATVVQFVTEWWAEIGVEALPEPIEQGSLNDLVYLGEYDVSFSGWGVGPNPTSILGQHTCDVLPETTDGSERSHENFFCNEDYDQLHRAQQVESDPDVRADLIHQQQRILYEEAPVIWLYYQNVVEAYNSDKISGMTLQPSENGMITGQQGFLWAYHSATPTGETAGDGTSTGVLVAIGAAILVVIAGGAFYLLRRRSTADERE
ncbi:ABC transporter substrate-binding protein [Natronoglycomyces albus]|uniref:ABC transporter substrate-binding protein n=1 Tax=Natronoglycomyces albus TaxID=2811108 RepID=A0A895XPB2_9ACTN|nr:ABC transporter substrate-binding protein [Natronoglycomyces albus]QSB04915.1 ABC transporter substrate-binding protein [Natronoglycomyces albus]